VVNLDGSGLDPTAAFNAIAASFETLDSETYTTEVFGIDRSRSHINILLFVR